MPHVTSRSSWARAERCGRMRPIVGAPFTDRTALSLRSAAALSRVTAPYATAMFGK